MLHWIDVEFLPGRSRRHLFPAKYSYILWNEAIRSLAEYEDIDSLAGSPWGARGLRAEEAKWVLPFPKALFFNYNKHGAAFIMIIILPSERT